MSELMREMPRYQCHKKVWALKIKEVTHNENPDTTGASGASSYGAVLVVQDGYAPISVSAEYVNKHNPQAGGYYVVYEDGYRSFSPAEPFEDGYSRFRGNDFGFALKMLRDGKRVGRMGWNGKGMFLLLIEPYSNNQYTLTESSQIVGTLLPYIAMKTADNGLVPWLASQTDMLANDWVVFADEVRAEEAA